MNKTVTFDTVVKPKFYILLGEDQRKVLGDVKVNSKIRVTVELIKDA